MNRKQGEMIKTVAGFPAVFDVVNGLTTVEDLSLREARLFVGAANFHALMAPERTLTCHLYAGDADLTPRTTDDRTFDGASRIFRHREGTVEIRSLVGAAPGHEAAGSSQELCSASVRHLHISRDGVLDHAPRKWVPTDPVRKALRRFRTQYPIAYDGVRDLELLRHRRGMTSAAARRDYAAEFAEGGDHDSFVLHTEEAPAETVARAVIIGVHWFELGGAERWAFETVRIVKDAGFLPIVLSNIDSHHPFITRAELDGALVIPFSQPTSFTQTPGTEELLASLLRTFDVRGVLVHHNQWLYDRLPWIKASRPQIPVVDSTHIVEYRGGGFPTVSAHEDRYIDVHHVISPTLQRWFTDVQGVKRDKIVMAPLGGLTTETAKVHFQTRPNAQQLTVAFVGRMSRQKAPEVFIAIAAKLQERGAGVRFIMHGDGELDEWVDDMIAVAGLDTHLERRTSDVPVADTLAEADLLVVTSHNEGLTLTTLEAIAQGVPVVSTDVGAQSDIIPAAGLFSRRPSHAVREGAEIVERFLDVGSRRSLWEQERAMEQRLLSHQNASSWLEKVVAQW